MLRSLGNLDKTLTYVIHICPLDILLQPPGMVETLKTVG